MPRYLFLTWALFRLIAYLSSGNVNLPTTPDSRDSNSGANDLGPWGKTQVIKDQLADKSYVLLEGFLMPIDASIAM